MRVLVVNVGSSSVKLAVLDQPDAAVSEAGGQPAPPLAADTLATTGPAAGPDQAHDELVGVIGAFAAAHQPIDAVGHRVVHGGDTFTAPVLVDADVRARIAALTELAPLHQPGSLAGIDAARSALPDVPQVACFDTAFHADLPAAARTYALPAAWRAGHGSLRKYGFHGLSHAYASRRAAAMLGGTVDAGTLRVVSCHLGSGASLAAVRGGRGVDTTMGFTPLDGLVMATRCGTVDPGLLLWLLGRDGFTVDGVSDALEHHAGLAGLSGTDGDLRVVYQRADSGDADARLAIDVYLHRLRQQIAGMTAALGGLDALVFTGGVGEHSAPVRAATVAGLDYLGARLDKRSNLDATPDADLSAPGSPVATLLIAAREDVEIAGQVHGLLATA